MNTKILLNGKELTVVTRPCDDVELVNDEGDVVARLAISFAVTDDGVYEKRIELFTE